MEPHTLQFGLQGVLTGASLAHCATRMRRTCFGSAQTGALTGHVVLVVYREAKEKQGQRCRLAEGLGVLMSSIREIRQPAVNCFPRSRRMCSALLAFATSLISYSREGEKEAEDETRGVTAVDPVVISGALLTTTAHPQRLRSSSLPLAPMKIGDGGGDDNSGKHEAELQKDRKMPEVRGGVVGAARSDMFFHATLARSFINALSLRGDDDVIDRLNYYYTPIMLSIACLIISAKQSPNGDIPLRSIIARIKCQRLLSGHYVSCLYLLTKLFYTINIVVQFVLLNACLKSDEYLFFGFQRFKIRNLVGLNIQHLINAACDTNAIVDPMDRQKAVDALASCFIDNLDLQSPNGDIPLRSIIARIKCQRLLSGHYVSCLYLLTKLFYTINIVVQFVLLNACLKSDEYLFFGFQVLQDLLAGKPWTESGHFPRVTLCDFEVRYLANLNRFSTLCWLMNSLVPSEKIDYILKFMQIAQSSDRKKQLKFSKGSPVERVYSVIPFAPHLLDRFVLGFLKSDGVFILRMMANHAGDIVVVHVVKALWQEFRERNWREFEEFEEIKDQHFRHHPKGSMATLDPAASRGDHRKPCSNYNERFDEQNWKSEQHKVIIVHFDEEIGEVPAGEQLMLGLAPLL
ncbi:Innexin [Ancylostoma ceylanicum]|uniref:Innexin n=1 Tax=Ancylostoma ceylanicum TaxID=53326 RepID=A0A0D6M4T5_9BILA|nr:Innexin [Ancylostoma ceylanicum]